MTSNATASPTTTTSGPTTAPKSRGWCFTINNWTEDEFYLVKNTNCTYLVMGKETAPGSGTPHLQGYCYFRTPKSLPSVKALSGWPRAHLEIARGTISQAVDYCKKDGAWVECGTQPTDVAVARATGSANGGAANADRWRAALTQAELGMEVEDPQINFVFYKAVNYHREKFLKSQRNLADTEVQMLWYWGEPRSGKSRKARQDHPNAYLKMCNKWWNNYINEEVVIIEDFDRAHDCLGHHLKVWADRYKFQAEYKGGSFVIRPRLIIVTSNWSIPAIWTEPETMLPLMARFKQVQFFKDLQIQATPRVEAPTPVPSPAPEQENTAPTQQLTPPRLTRQPPIRARVEFAPVEDVARTLARMREMTQREIESEDEVEILESSSQGTVDLTGDMEDDV